MTVRALRSPRTAHASFLRRGVTLLELLIVVVVLGLVTSVAALVMPAKVVPPDDTPHRIANARTRALRTGQPVSVVLQLDTVFSLATAMPDGTVLADSAARIDRLTGKPLPPVDTTRLGGS
jgi:prepilin-type N-terminal cleavage/methylation domain-containing protein